MDKLNTTYDVIIIGAGPAGLSAASMLIKSGLKTLIIEKGKRLNERNIDNSIEVMSGFGGSGLFSDGKLSFPPSASNLWTNLEMKSLQESYSEIRSLLSSVGLVLPNWKPEWEESKYYQHQGIKNYDSTYLSQDLREKIILLFQDIVKEHIIFEKTVCGIKKSKNNYLLRLNNGDSLSTAMIICATGKYGAVLLDDLNMLDNNYRYIIEMGFRIETKSEYFLPYKYDQIDYKVIKNVDEFTELRTFCCCRDGYVTKSEFDKLATYNGYKTNDNSKYSNIGILVRSQLETSIYADEMQKTLHKNNPRKMELKQYIDTDEYFVGPNCDNILKENINIVIDTNDNSINSSQIYGPEIEYVGKYPLLDNNSLKMIQDDIWVVGDCTGIFRGLFAALISGTYSALEIIQKNKQNINIDITQARLKIKKSQTDDMILVFTAQSKAYFYCRDAICEFVFKQGYLPINPFRVFDYFLNDRVSRDIIRRGNNQLIKSCDELWVFGPIADGVLFEISLAMKFHKNIRFYSIGTRADDIRTIRLNDVIFEPEVHAKQIKKNELISFIKNNAIINKTDLDEYIQLSIFEDNND